MRALSDREAQLGDQEALLSDHEALTALTVLDSKEIAALPWVDVPGAEGTCVPVAGSRRNDRAGTSSRAPLPPSEATIVLPTAMPSGVQEPNDERWSVVISRATGSPTFQT